MMTVFDIVHRDWELDRLCGPMIGSSPAANLLSNRQIMGATMNDDAAVYDADLIYRHTRVAA